MYEALLDSAASKTDTESSVSSRRSSTAAATGKAYRALKELVTAARPKALPIDQVCPTLVLLHPSTPLSFNAQVEEQCDDPALVRCGLEKCVAADGSVEWVAPQSKERFAREGAKCLIWNQHSLGLYSEEK